MFIFRMDYSATLSNVITKEQLELKSPYKTVALDGFQKSGLMRSLKL